MIAGSRLFTLLQHGDSLFPSGLTSFSWGLEQLFEERRVTDVATLRRFVESQLRLRWASFDRAFLSASHAAAGDLELVTHIDDFCVVSIPAKELREGSARAGQALLAVIIGVALVFNMLVAAVVGVVVPLALKTFRVDPAIASSVIITTFTDVCGFFSFLGLATLLIRFLL